MMTPEQKKTLERLKARHAARKLTRQQAPLLASLIRMEEQEAFANEFNERINKNADKTP